MPPFTDREGSTKKIRMSTRETLSFIVRNVVRTVFLHMSQQGNAELRYPAFCDDA